MTITTGWIISRKWDLILLLGFPIFGIFFAHLGQSIPSVLANSSLFLLGVLIFIDSAHLLVTGFPLHTRLEKSAIKVSTLLALAAFTLILSISVWNYDLAVFSQMLAFIVTIHQIRQFSGWLSLSQRKAGQRKEWRDELMVFNLCLVPFLVFASGLGPVAEPRVFVEGDLKFMKLPPEVVSALTWVFWTYTTFYFTAEIRQVLKTKRLELSKYVILASCILCFSYPYMAAALALFWLPHTLVHGSTYILYNHKQITLNDEKSKFRLLPLYLLAVALLGLMFYSFSFYDPSENPVLKYLYSPVIWAIPLFHYFSDTLIWRSRYTKVLRS